MPVRRALLLTAGTVLVVLLSPLAGAGACISHMDLVVGPGTARFDMQQVFADEEAIGLRMLVDEGTGDGDGEVTDQEATAWGAAVSGQGDARVTACLDDWSDFMGGYLRQSDVLPGTLEGLGVGVNLQGERSTTSGQPLVVRISGTLTYDVEDPEADVVVVPEAFEGLSETLECISPQHVETDFAQNPCGDAGDDPLPSMRRLAIVPVEGARIDAGTVEPAPAREAFDGRSIVLSEFVAEGTLTEIRFRLVAADTPGVSGSGDASWIAAVAVAAAGLSGLAWFALGQRARYRFWWLLSVMGFTRIRREKALDHRRRESILAAVESEPGVHLGALQRGLGMATGTLVHHLRVLEHAGLVRRRHLSNRVLFVPADHQGPIKGSRSALQSRLLDLVHSAPGLSQSELAERLNAPRNTVAYNVRRLIEEGRLEVRREGRTVRHFLTGEGPQER